MSNGCGRAQLWTELDPQEVYGSDFPWVGETFRVLKEKELKAYGGTRRLVLEKWDEMPSADAAHGG